MNREILFRAKCTHNKEWIEGLLTTMWGQYHIINPANESTAYPIDPETICQYTGLADKNGRKIFEGDTCIIRGSSIDEEDGYFTVEWDKDSARFTISNERLTVDFEGYYGYECEVAGNKFDNPELLEGV